MNLIAVQEDLAKVLRFLERPADSLHLTLDMRGTPLQRRIWEKLRAISVGRTVTYMELRVGSARSHRPALWLAVALQTQSRSRFLATASSETAVTSLATAGASSANANCSRWRRWLQLKFALPLGWAAAPSDRPSADPAGWERSLISGGGRTIDRPPRCGASRSPEQTEGARE